jgi:hypothetical protein
LSLLLLLPGPAVETLCPFLRTPDITRLSTGSKELLAQYGSKLAKLSSRKCYDLAAVPALLALLQWQECLREVTIFKAEIILPCFFPAIASGRLRWLWLNGELIPTCSIVPLVPFCPWDACHSWKNCVWLGAVRI